MASSPVEPVRGVAGRVRRAGAGGVQAADLRDGQRDHPGIGRGRLIGPDRRRCLGIGSVAEQRGGDSADRQGDPRLGVPASLRVCKAAPRRKARAVPCLPRPIRGNVTGCGIAGAA